MCNGKGCILGRSLCNITKVFGDSADNGSYLPRKVSCGLTTNNALSMSCRVFKRREIGRVVCAHERVGIHIFGLNRRLSVELLANYREIIYNQRTDRASFTSLLMKQRNQQGKWTREERKELLVQIKQLSSSVPYLIILSSPFGFLLLPFLAKALDRRKVIRLN